ncbi:MAG: dihydrofolate reductase [Phycisphaeraceae bacterium]
MNTPPADVEPAPPRITLIAAMSRNRVIGRDNALPWRCSADLRRFKRLTTGAAIVMGRRTWDSIGRPLPQRLNIVLTRDPALHLEGAESVGDLEAAFATAREAGYAQIFVIGGEQIYRLAMPHAHAIELTLVDIDIENGDAFFPEIPADQYELTHREAHPADEKNPQPYAFLTYQRRST